MKNYLMSSGCGVLIAILLVSCQQVTIRDASISSSSGIAVLNEGGMEYGLFTPVVSETGRKYPIMLYLHGYTEKPLLNLPWQVAALQKIEPCFVLIPTCSEDQGASAWGGTYDQDLRPSLKTVLGLLDKLQKIYPIDPQRVYVYGGSMGGEGVFMLLAKQPQCFAGAIAVAGYTLVKDADKMATVPLWILDGSKDIFIDTNVTNVTEASRMIYAAIQKAGGKNVKYTEYPGADHMTVWPLVQKESGLLDWLLKQRRP